MATPGFQLFLAIFLFFMFSLSLSSTATDEDRKVYIAYLGSLSNGEYFPTSQHFSMIQAVIKKSSVEDYLVRSYKRSFNGFAVKLTDEEAQKLASMEGVISVFPNKVYHLQTTNSWEFLGLSQTVDRSETIESNLIIGVIDSGIWPESKSFNDKGFGPPPKKWKGTCAGGQNFTCNNKLIGARVYATEFATDTEGHGTHTASTAAGNNVKNASFFGLANGTARGGVPSARIAAYKVCDDNGCGSDAILAAFDDAIADGVDIITISIGSDVASEFFQDPVAFGSFHAAVKGILTTQSAGNLGSAGPQTVASLAPWLLTVAASTTDRLFVTKVILGNNKTLSGFSINSFSLNGTKFPLGYGKQVSNCSEEESRTCSISCLATEIVKDKIVLCDEIGGSFEAYYEHSVGAIVKNPKEDDKLSFVLPLPGVALNDKEYRSLISYWNSTKEPKAEILRSETIKDSSAPLVAGFSSRGPNFIVPDILKPDISAPGVDILASFSPVAPPVATDFVSDGRRVTFNIISGTSMACPHVAGAAAYVKSIHPDWSPSAIKSALMTTGSLHVIASPMQNNAEREFAYGSGHLNPLQAINPGLIYDASKGDYVKFLCSIGYGEGVIRQLTQDNNSCSKNDENSSPRDLNYPSLTALVAANKSFTVHFHRTVTNVGVSNSTYKATVSSNSKLVVKVNPQVLSFKSLKEKKSFNVIVTGEALTNASMVSTSLVWSGDVYSVRSPIVIHTYEGVYRKDNFP